MKIILIFSIIFFTHNSMLLPHGDEKHEKNDTVTVVGNDTIAINGIPVDSVIQEETIDHENMSGEFNFFAHLPEHLHNKIVHLPIGLIIASFILILLGFKWEGLDTGIKILVILAALSAAAAYFTGSVQEEAFEGTPKEWIVETHETLGISTALSIWLWAIFLFIKPLKKYVWIFGVIAFILVLITGLYGGIAAHG